MGEMMFHPMKFCAESLTWEGLLQQNGNRRSAAIA